MSTAEPPAAAWQLADEQATEELGRRFARTLPAGGDAGPLVLYLQGELGAGKTTFARGLILGLGAPGPVRSPTYTLLEPHAAPGLTVLHLDLYRLIDAQELEPLALREQAVPGTLWVVEWPERGGSGLPPADLALGLRIGAGGHAATATAASALGISWLAAMGSPPA